MSAARFSAPERAARKTLRELQTDLKVAKIFRGCISFYSNLYDCFMFVFLIDKIAVNEMHHLVCVAHVVSLPVSTENSHLSQSHRETKKGPN